MIPRALSIALTCVIGCGARAIEPAPPPRLESPIDAAEPAPVPESVDAGTPDAWIAIDEGIVDASFDPIDGSDDEDDALLRRGRRVYLRICADCHDDGPAIVGRHLASHRITTAVRRGGRRMPPISRARLGDADLAALATYLAR